jgi:hypothetical protein
VDNNASALSFDASGKAGILEIVTTDGSEVVNMSGGLNVVGAVSASSIAIDGALPVSEGGSGVTSLADKAVLISQDSGTDAIGALALTGNGEIIVGGTNGPAVEAAADVAGTGLDASVGDGTLAINVAAAQTTITSIINSSLGKIGTNASQEYITFGTSNEVNTFVNNTERLSVTNTGVDVTGTLSVSDTGSAGYLTAPEISGSFVGDGSNLTGVSQDIDSLTELDAAPHATQDEFLISDNGTEKRISMTNVSKGVFALVTGGDATIAANGAVTIADNTIGNSELKQNDDITLQSLTLTGDLTVNGTTTTIATANTKVEDQLMFLGTGSAGTNLDVGIMVQSGSVDLSGSAFYHDTNSERWAVAKNLGHNAAAITPLQFVTTVQTSTSPPSSTNGEYGVGEMWVETDTQDIYIRTA